MALHGPVPGSWQEAWARVSSSAQSCAASRSPSSRGEAVGLLGPNGAGKTTTFYMIMGLVRPDSGEITLDGNPITSLPMYRRARLGIGYLPQEASVFRGLNVEQNIKAVIEISETDPDRQHIMLDGLAAGVRDRPPAPHARPGPFGRRAAPGRDRPRARQPVPATSSSMSRWPASIPSPSVRSATLSPISSIAGSVCSSPTITCGKRWRLSTGHISCMMARF